MFYTLNSNVGKTEGIMTKMNNKEQMEKEDREDGRKKNTQKHRSRRTSVIEQ